MQREFEEQNKSKERREYGSGDGTKKRKYVSSCHKHQKSLSKVLLPLLRLFNSYGINARR